MAERVRVVEAALHRNGAATRAEIAEQFKRPKDAAMAEILEPLMTIGAPVSRSEISADKTIR